MTTQPAGNPPRIRFEPDAQRFATLVGELATGEMTIVVVDAPNLPGGMRHVSTDQWAIAADLAARDPEAMIDVRTAETLAAADQAQILTRSRPDHVLVPECRTHLQAQFAVEMAARSMTVTVASDRTRFLALVDDVATARKYIDGAR